MTQHNIRLKTAAKKKVCYTRNKFAKAANSGKANFFCVSMHKKDLVPLEKQIYARNFLVHANIIRYNTSENT